MTSGPRWWEMGTIMLERVAPCFRLVPQPITSRLAVGKHPDGLAGFVVYFGTGKYLERTDNMTTGTPAVIATGKAQRLQPGKGAGYAGIQLVVYDLSGSSVHAGITLACARRAGCRLSAGSYPNADLCQWGCLCWGNRQREAAGGGGLHV